MDYERNEQVAEKQDSTEKAQKIWKELEQARNYKSKENLYDIIRTNEDFYIGEHHKGVDQKNLKNLVFNFLGQTLDVKVASVSANKVSIMRSPEPVDKGDKKTEEAVKAFNESDKLNWERMNMDYLNEQFLVDAAITGLGVTHFYWDEDLMSGNTFVNKGDIRGELIDSPNFYVSNPNEEDVQKQDWIIISQRFTVKQLKKMAKDHGVNETEIELIKGDETTVYEAFSKADQEQDNVKTNSDQGVLNVKMWKKDGKVYFCKSTQNVVIQEETDTELTRYPIAIMPWKPRKRFIYGEAEFTRVIENQKVVNLLEAMKTFNAVLMGVPKFAYYKSVVNGVTNAIGQMHPITGNPKEFGSIGNIMGYVQPQSMSADVNQSIQENIERTQTLAGVNQNILGAARPENAAALLTQIKQANIPIETYRRRFYKYLEDVALIWADFYKNKYKLDRKIVTEEGEEIVFNGSEYNDISMRTKIDVGPSTQYSEITQLQQLNDMWAAGIFNEQVPVNSRKQYVERLPKNVVAQQDKLLEEIESEAGDNQLIEMLLQFLPPEIQQQVASMPKPQQVQVIMQQIQMATQQ